MAEYCIGIDLGTSGVKCLLLGDDGVIVDSASEKYTPDFGANGHVEQDPSVWWDKTFSCVKALAGKNPQISANIKALAVSGQMHSSVFLDKDGGVIRPAILWNDTRTTPQTKEIYEIAGSVENVLSEVYNLALEGFTLPKILWLKENEPDNFKKVSSVIMPKDYINYRLTGNVYTDYSDAAGTLAFDVKNRRFNESFVEKIGIPKEILPKAIESTGTVGVISAQTASELGLPHGVKVIAGGADNSCAAIGNGVVSSNSAVVSVGTSGTVVAFLDDIKSKVTGAVHLFNYSYPNSFYAMGCMLSAGECLNWLTREILTGESFDELNELVAKTPIGSNHLLFAPYLFGERCPHTDPSARGIFFGLSSLTKKGEMARAVMEGVAFGLKDMFNLVLDFASMDEVYITGGGAKSPVWSQIICDVLNVPLKLLNISEGPAFGAALIAGVGAGVFPSFADAKEKSMRVIKTYTPQNPEKYAEYYKVFQKLYTTNKSLYQELLSL
ncbi:xylulokinase [Clostridia bacterium]|nr:xylulokinase [Clostridia bacterium]